MIGIVTPMQTSYIEIPKSATLFPPELVITVIIELIIFFTAFYFIRRNILKKVDKIIAEELESIKEEQKCQE